MVDSIEKITQNPSSEGSFARVNVTLIPTTCNTVTNNLVTNNLVTVNNTCNFETCNHSLDLFNTGNIVPTCNTVTDCNLVIDCKTVTDPVTVNNISENKPCDRYFDLLTFIDQNMYSLKFLDQNDEVHHCFTVLPKDMQLAVPDVIPNLLMTQSLKLATMILLFRNYSNVETLLKTEYFNVLVLWSHNIALHFNRIVSAAEMNNLTKRFTTKFKQAIENGIFWFAVNKKSRKHKKKKRKAQSFVNKNKSILSNLFPLGLPDIPDIAHIISSQVPTDAISTDAYKPVMNGIDEFINLASFPILSQLPKGRYHEKIFKLWIARNSKILQLENRVFLLPSEIESLVEITEWENTKVVNWWKSHGLHYLMKKEPTLQQTYLDYWMRCNWRLFKNNKKLTQNSLKCLQTVLLWNEKTIVLKIEQCRSCLFEYLRKHDIFNAHATWDATTAICPKCATVPPARVTLEQFNRHKAKPHPVKCKKSQCSLTFLSKFARDRHVQKAHSPYNQCPKCDKIQVTSDMDWQKRHLRSNHKWPCTFPNCNKIFKRLGELSNHIRANHTLDSIPENEVAEVKKLVANFNKSRQTEEQVDEEIDIVKYYDKYVDLIKSPIEHVHALPRLSQIMKDKIQNARTLEEPTPESVTIPCNIRELWDNKGFLVTFNGEKMFVDNCKHIHTFRLETDQSEDCSCQRDECEICSPQDWDGFHCVEFEKRILTWDKPLLQKLRRCEYNYKETVTLYYGWGPFDLGITELPCKRLENEFPGFHKCSRDNNPLESKAFRRPHIDVPDNVPEFEAKTADFKCNIELKPQFCVTQFGYLYNEHKVAKRTTIQFIAKGLRREGLHIVYMKSGRLFKDYIPLYHIKEVKFGTSKNVNVMRISCHYVYPQIELLPEPNSPNAYKFINRPWYENRTMYGQYDCICTIKNKEIKPIVTFLNKHSLTWSHDNSYSALTVENSETMTSLFETLFIECTVEDKTVCKYNVLTQSFTMRQKPPHSNKTRTVQKHSKSLEDTWKFLYCNRIICELLLNCRDNAGTLMQHLILKNKGNTDSDRKVLNCLKGNKRPLECCRYFDITSGSCAELPFPLQLKLHSSQTTLFYCEMF